MQMANTKEALVVFGWIHDIAYLIVKKGYIVINHPYAEKLGGP